MRIWRLSTLLLFIGCTDYVPGAAEPEDLSVVPSSGSTESDTTIQIRGQLVLTRLRVDYAQPEAVDPIARVRVWIRAAETDEQGEELRPIRLSAEKHLETIVPAGMTPGLYDVVVEDAYERRRVVENAFTVIGVECSDGIQRGEPCGESCTVIVGCECRAEDQCAPVCGDGLIKGDERCDDGGSERGDGCDEECRVEPGFSCEGAPSTCSTGCGDGVTAGSEGCDDANFDPGDGCDPGCQIEEGWNCAGGRCESICGDQRIVGEEVCEPEVQRIGCGPDCRPLPGFECEPAPNEPSRIVCRPKCGDGLKRGDERCDDGSVGGDDGCVMCMVVEGWNCQEEPSVCHPVCGDGLLVGDEECDPGSDPEVPGEVRRACGPDCRAAPGYVCQDGNCAPIRCDPGSVCDDANACTHNDVCRLDELCRGLPKLSCLNLCQTSCIFDAVLPGVNCCSDSCGLNGQCPDCRAVTNVPEPMCNYACQVGECRARCESGTNCTFEYVPSAVVVGGDGRVDCQSGAVCSMSCDGSQTVLGGETICTMNCEQGAICMLENCVDASCEMNCADQSQMECQTPQGRVVVCGRACPE